MTSGRRQAQQSARPRQRPLRCTQPCRAAADCPTPLSTQPDTRAGSRSSCAARGALPLRKASRRSRIRALQNTTHSNSPTSEPDDVGGKWTVGTRTAIVGLPLADRCPIYSSHSSQQQQRRFVQIGGDYSPCAGLE